MDVIRFFAIHHMRNAFAVTAFLLLALGAAPARAQQTVGGWTVFGLREVQIAPNEWALVGAAELQRGDVNIYADEIDYFQDEDRAVASGNVLMSQGQNRIGADSADFDTKTGLGVFYHAYGIATMQPPKRNTPAGPPGAPGAFMPGALPPQLAGQENDVYFFGDVIEKIGPKKYKITNGGFTACLQPTPRWNLTGKTIIVNINHYTILQQMVLNVKGVPLFYLPVMYYPTQQDNRATGFLIPTYGSSSVLGTSIHTAFFWAIDRSQDATIQDEWFSKLGQGIGGEYRYNWGHGDDGTIDGLVLTPNGGGAADGLPTQKSFDLVGSADETLPGRFRARANVNYFSDLATHQLFNNNLAVYASNDRQYAANIVGVWHGYSINGTFNRDESFYTDTDSVVSGATPRIDIARSERPLFSGSPLYFGATGEFAHLNSDTISQETGDVNNALSRFDISPTLRYPFKKWQFLTVNTSITFDDTYYTRSYAIPVDPNNPDSLSTSGLNPIVSQGLNRHYATITAQFTGPVFSRIFDTPHNGYAEKFKHTIEPLFQIQRVTSIDDSIRERIVAIDTGSNIDNAVGGTTNMEYGLNNHLMAKRKVGQSSQSTEILLFSIQQTYYTNKTASQFDTGYLATSAAPSNFSPVRVELRATPTPQATGDVATQFDARTHNMDVFTMTGSYNWLTRLRTSTTWARNFTENAAGSIPSRTLTSNSLSLTTSTQTPDNRLGGSYSLFYDFLNSPHMQQQGISAFYNAQCCGLTMSYLNRPAIGIPGVTNNHTFFISVTLAGLGSVSPFSGGMGMPGTPGYR